MNFTKQFIIAYMILFFLVNLLGLPLLLTLDNIPFTDNIVLNIITFFINIIVFLVNFLFFTTPYLYLNIVLWAIRFIAVLEIVSLIRGVSSD